MCMIFCVFRKKKKNIWKKQKISMKKEKIFGKWG